MPNVTNVVPVIDTSASMTYNGYVDITKRDSKAFVSYAREGDGLAIVNYDVNAHSAYPSTSSLAIVDANLTQAIAAANAIDGLSFNGNATAIGNGIIQGKTFLDSAAAPKAMVLLSDGYQNSGPNPLSVLPNYPIYTCAMGPNADIALMQNIASGTGGSYYNSPYPSTMMFIYNEIRSLPTFVQSIQNKQNNILPQSYAMVPATFAADNSGGQFGIVWDDKNLSYTSSPNPTATQISITLVTPTGVIFAAQPQIIGEGYVVFNIPNPVEGLWYAQVISGAQVQTIRVTTGGFEFPNNSEGAANLFVSADKAKMGKPLRIMAEVKEGKRTIHNLQARASVMQPTISVENAIKMHKSDIAGVKASSADIARGVPDNIARLGALRHALLPHRDILAHRNYPLITSENKKGQHLCEIKDTCQAGSYTIHVKATGISYETKRPFVRSKIITVCVS